MTIQILFSIFAIAIVVVFFLNKSAAKKYRNDQIDSIRDLNENDSEVNSYMAQYELLSSEELIGIAESEKREKRLKAIKKVLAQRDLTQFNNISNF
jgi:ACT domain-containing protein